MTMSYIAGLIAARQISLRALAGLVGLAIFINSKQAFTLWMRGSSKDRALPPVIFLLHLLSASGLIIWMAGRDLVYLLPYGVVPVAYLLALYFLGEHAICTEVAGFALLSLAGLVAKFAAAGEVDPRLFVAVAIFFTAGVFRVRIQLRKEMLYRIVMVAYVGVSVVVFRSVGVSALPLLPLADNIIFALTLYQAKLRTTGWIEMSKGAVFLALMQYSYY